MHYIPQSYAHWGLLHDLIVDGSHGVWPRGTAPERFGLFGASCRSADANDGDQGNHQEIMVKYDGFYRKIGEFDQQTWQFIHFGLHGVLLVYGGL